MDFILIINGFLLGWFIMNFSPIEKYRYKVAEKLSKYTYLSKLMVCLKCMSFHMTWILGLILTQEFMFFEAIGAAVLAYVFEIITKRNNKITLHD